MRKSGIVLHLAYVDRKEEIKPFEFELIKLLQNCSVKVWQHLPINPPGKYDSPYSALSVFAGDLNILSCKIEVKYDEKEFQQWFKENKEWAIDWALYTFLKKKHHNSEWFNWPEIYKFRDKSALEYIKRNERECIDELIMEQFIFDKKWALIKEKSNQKGISLFGDMPFYVALDSADVWANPQLFDLDRNLLPIKIGGVPPDYFSENGQVWENPLYKWKNHRKNGFKWWQMRIKINKKRFDLLRIDHFRALVSSWCIDYGSETAINGYWRKGPGRELIDKITEILPAEFLVAEDLGIITNAVKKLIKDYNLLGMRVLQFVYNSELPNEHHHDNIIQNTVCYIGTHDTNTAKGWFNQMKNSKNVNCFDHLLEEYNMNETNVSKQMINIAMKTKADICMMTIQDLMNLGEEGRINVPGKNKGNWKLFLRQQDILEIDWKFVRNVATNR